MLQRIDDLKDNVIIYFGFPRMLAPVKSSFITALSHTKPFTLRVQGTLLFKALFILALSLIQ